MLINNATQHPAIASWDGATGRPVDIRRFNAFAWTFEIIADINTDAVFNVVAAPASATDPCVPGAFVPVPEVPTCEGPAVPSDQATITIPAGTVAGSLCTGTLPCYPNAFVQLNAASGDTGNVRAAITLSGPQGPFDSVHMQPWF